MTTKKPFAPLREVLKPPEAEITKVFLLLFVLLPRWTTEIKLYKKRQRKKELLFVNKKKQKNFVNFWPVAVQRPREAEQKFFGSFFQKRAS